MYEALDTANPLPAFGGSATPVVPPTPVVTPPVTPVTPPVKPPVKPPGTAVVPSAAWAAPTDERYLATVAAC